MSDPTLLVLASLADGEKHGYAMMLDIETFAGVKLGPGTLYGAITRLEQQGWIRPVNSTDRPAALRHYSVGPRAFAGTARGIAAGGEDRALAIEACMNRLARWMMRLYPAQWRERYGDEVDALLTDTNADARTVADLARGGIRMRFSTLSFSKLVLTLGIGGLLFGFACSYLVTPEYVSKATLQIVPAKVPFGGASDKYVSSLNNPLNERVLQMQTRILGRAGLFAIRKNIHFVFVAAPVSRSASAFDIEFTDPDAGKARQTAETLVNVILTEAVSQPDVIIDVLDDPTMPSRPVKPNRRILAATGGIVGILAACLIGLFRKRWNVQPGRLALNG